MAILDGKTYAVTIKFTGLPGQLDYDSSNMDLILHDGTTMGGIRFYNADNADQRYQAKTPELDGLDFEPQQRGLLIRRGPADYRIRQLTVNESNLSIAEPRGYEGNPYIELTEEVKSNHTWSGAHTYEQKVNFDGGIKGNVTGDVTGSLLGDSSGTHKGSVDTTGKTLTLDDEQVKIEWLELFAQQSLVPAGAIIMWGGAASAIPRGWLLCNGQNGTPDLRDRFIVGAMGQLQPGNSGGDDPIQPTVTIAEGGAHSHSASGGTVASATTGITASAPSKKVDAGGSASGMLHTGVTINDPGHTHQLEGLQIQQGGAHSHTGTVEAFEMIPPYYALCFIMKANTAVE